MMTYPVVLLTGKGRAGKDTAGRVLCEEMSGVSIALADPIKRFFLKAGMKPEQLWGSEKETEFARPDFPGGHCKFWLADALGDWLTPGQLLRIEFDRWEKSLPDRATPRYLMQTFGTECVRSFSPDLWVDFGLFAADQLLAGRNYYRRELGLIPRRDPLLAPPSVVTITDGRFRNEVLKVKQRGGFATLILRPNGTQEGFTDDAKAHVSESEQDSMPRWWFDAVLQNAGGLPEFERSVSQLARYGLMRLGVS